MNNQKSDQKCRCGKPITSSQTYVEYTVRQIAPAKDTVAIFAEEDGQLSTMPIDFVAVAKATTIHREYCGEPGHFNEIDREIDTVIVGVELCEGWFSVVNEHSNFAGLMHVGDDIDNCLGCLDIGKNQRAWQLVEERRKAKRASAKAEEAAMLDDDVPLLKLD